MIEAHVIFRGDVQGVFFRATARELAQNLDLTGTVKNLPDGSVEMVVQGAKEKIEVLIERLKQKYALCEANSVSVTYCSITKSLSEFHITH